MSHQGLKILYEIVNAREEYLAERVFAPWIDREEQLRRDGLAARRARVGAAARRTSTSLGFTLPYELTAHEHPDHARPGAAAAARARPRRAPPARHRRRARRLQPRAARRLLRLLPARRRRGGDPRDHGRGPRVARRRRETREEQLARLARIEGVYVPRFYRAEYDAAGRFAALVPLRDGAPPPHPQAHARRPRRRPLPGAPAGALRRDHPRPDHDRDRARLHPALPLLPGRHHLPPLPRAQHARRSWRWPSAGLAATGYDELSLAALSLRRPPAHRDADRRADAPLRASAASRSRCPRCAPARSPTASCARSARSSAPASRSPPRPARQRLRDVISKGITEEVILETCRRLFAQGWSSVKLYFMIGLPTETEEDRAGIVALVERIRRLGREVTGPQAGGDRRGLELRAQAAHPVPVGRAAAARRAAADPRPAARGAAPRAARPSSGTTRRSPRSRG